MLVFLLGVSTILSGFREGGYRDLETAADVVVDTTNFSGNLNSLDDTVQKALDTLDDMVSGGGVTGSSDNSLIVSGSDVIINTAHSNDWTAPQSISTTSANPFAVSSTYTGTEDMTGVSSNLTINTASGNDAFGVYGFRSTITDNQDTSGLIDDATMIRTLYSATMTRNADSTVQWNDGREELTGYDLYMNRSGAFSGVSHPVSMDGSEILLDNSISYTNAAASNVQTMRGQYILVQATGTSAGPLTRDMTGLHIHMANGDASATITSNPYMAYFSGSLGPDGGYVLYSTVAQPSYLAGDLILPADAYAAGWNGNNEVPTKNDVYDKIESLSSGGLSQAQVLTRGLGS